MTKALFKKQLMESFAWVYRDRKTGKNRTGAGLVIYLLLYVFVFGMLGSLFYMMAQSLCAPLVQMDLGWLYFAIMGLVSVVLGVFASVFNTAEALYRAKDNDLLLSMPIPTGRILAMRLCGVYALGLLYELFAMVPTLMVWFGSFEISAVGMVFSLLIPLCAVCVYFDSVLHFGLGGFANQRQGEKQKLCDGDSFLGISRSILCVLFQRLYDTFGVPCQCTKHCGKCVRILESPLSDGAGSGGRACTHDLLYRNGDCTVRSGLFHY